MNILIAQRFNAIEERLLQCNIVASYLIIKKEVARLSGKIRLKIVFTDRSVAEFFEYVVVMGDDTLQLSKYSFHWQSTEDTLISRWDNAPHHPELPNAPHHKHNSDLSVTSINEPIDVFYVINYIEQTL